MTTIVVPENYGYVLLIALGLTPLLSYVHGTVVTIHRKPAGVPYPNCYATAQQCKENSAAYKFNCAQRAHANFLENAPWAVFSMLVAGLSYPMLTVGLSLGWIGARAAYGYGYVFSGKEEGRGRRLGFPFWLFQGALWGMSLVGAWRMI